MYLYVRASVLDLKIKQLIQIVRSNIGIHKIFIITVGMKLLMDTDDGCFVQFLASFFIDYSAR